MGILELLLCDDGNVVTDSSTNEEMHVLNRNTKKQIAEL
jgi:hypothetical protein